MGDMKLIVSLRLSVFPLLTADMYDSFIALTTGVKINVVFRSGVGAEISPRSGLGAAAAQPSSSLTFRSSFRSGLGAAVAHLSSLSLRSDLGDRVCRLSLGSDVNDDGNMTLCGVSPLLVVARFMGSGDDCSRIRDES